MEPTFLLSPNMTKAERYEAFIPQWKAFIDGETDVISILANTSAALKEAFRFFWIGFYIVKDGELHVGPFQGSVACYRIKKVKGVCGTAWKDATTQVVPDVELFPGHIACSSDSRSEIVVPIMVNGEVYGVLDIDSDELATFDDTDRIYLEKMMSILAETL